MGTEHRTYVKLNRRYFESKHKYLVLSLFNPYSANVENMVSSQ